MDNMCVLALNWAREDAAKSGDLSVDEVIDRAYAYYFFSCGIERDSAEQAEADFSKDRS